MLKVSFFCMLPLEQGAGQFSQRPNGEEGGINNVNYLLGEHHLRAARAAARAVIEEDLWECPLRNERAKKRRSTMRAFL